MAEGAFEGWLHFHLAELFDREVEVLEGLGAEGGGQGHTS